MKVVAFILALASVAGLFAYAVAPSWMRALIVPSPVVAHAVDVTSDEVRNLLSLAATGREPVLSPLPTTGSVQVLRHRWFSWLRTRGDTVVVWEEPRHSRVWHFSKPGPDVRLMCEEEVFYGPSGAANDALSIVVGTMPGGGAGPTTGGVRIERSGSRGTSTVRPEDLDVALRELGWPSRGANNLDAARK